MSHSDNVQIVTEAVTSQVKLFSYDEEELAIWFRLIEAQLPWRALNPRKLRYTNALASLPEQVLRDILDSHCLQQIRSSF
jgi:hypothetical protein